MKNLTIVPAVGLAVLAATIPTLAHAYVGPGAGLSLAAAFWAVLAAVGTIIGFTLLWPIRRMLRRRSATTSTRAAHDEGTEDRQDMGRERGSTARP